MLFRLIVSVNKTNLIRVAMNIALVFYFFYVTIL